MSTDDLSIHAPKLGLLLANTAIPLPVRFRTLFALKNMGGKAGVDAIAMVFSGNDSSALLKHECAYCLGQLRDTHAIPVLASVLGNTAEEPMVRHEAGEALGAIATAEVIPILEQYENDPVVEVKETCVIALDRVRWVLAEEEKKNRNAGAADTHFMSVDPAPACESLATSVLREHMLDTKRPLFERYRAMFALRNRNDAESALALVDGFQDKSALFRHEIGYVLGQMQNPASVDGLRKALKEDTNPMVRHEAAEALGSIATDDCLPVLQEYSHDAEQVVKESCDVALDMHEYENSEEFATLEQTINKLLVMA